MSTQINSASHTSDFDIFLTNSAGRVTSDQAQVMRRVYDIAVAESWDIGWGPGDAISYFTIGIPSVKNRPVMSVWMWGFLLLDYDKIDDSAIAERVRESLAAFAAEHFEKAIHQTRNDEIPSEDFVLVDPEDWTPKVVDVIKYLRKLSTVESKQ